MDVLGASEKEQLRPVIVIRAWALGGKYIRSITSIAITDKFYQYPELDI
jgi:hypothetical protein